MRIFQTLTRRHNRWIVWSDFIVMFACSLSNPMDELHREERERIYQRTIKRYPKEEQELFPKLVAETVLEMDDHPEQDLLGGLYMELNLGNKKTGQVFTPYGACVVMAKLNLGDIFEKIRETGFIRIHDPCCGGGATLIAAIHEARKQLEQVKLNYRDHILVTGQEIDGTVALMCYIQLCLLGVAGFVKIGDTISDPMHSKDSINNYWFTPMYFAPVWTMRRILDRLKEERK